MNDPIVHIGYHKTASTWLQQRYFPELAGVRMLSRTRIIEALIQPHALVFDADAARARLLEDPDDPGAGPPDSTPLISLEALSGYPLNAGLHGFLAREMVARLRAVLPAAVIVAVLRRQPDVLASSYAQYVSRGGTRSPAAYLGIEHRRGNPNYRPDKTPDFDLVHFSYWPLLSLYREAFGAARVRVYLYEDFKADSARFLNAMEQDLGLHSRQRLPSSRFGRVRKSYPPWLLAVVRRLNLLTSRNVVNKSCVIHVPGAYSVIRGLGKDLVRILPDGSGTDPARVFGSKLVNRINRYYAPFNQRLAEEFHLPLADHGYALQSPDADP